MPEENRVQVITSVISIGCEDWRSEDRRRKTAACEHESVIVKVRGCMRNIALFRRRM